MQLIMKKILLRIYLLFAVTIVFSCSKDDSSFIDGLPNAVINNDPPGAPPRILTETWFGHSKKIYRQYYDDYTTVYYDDNVNREIAWTGTFTSDSWEYVINNYGFGEGNRLFSVFHSESEEAFYANVFDLELNENLIDVPLEGSEMTNSNTDAILKEISKIVETSSFGINKSPASEIWQDKWAEIFSYDVYSGVGMEAEAQNIYDTALEASANYPVFDTYWFRDWFYPIYANYGGTLTFKKFFQLLSLNFPAEGGSYARSMNLGEFIHFFNGAANEDLEPLAAEAFGIAGTWKEELAQARIDFPSLSSEVEVVDLTTEAILTVSHENGDGPGGNEGSLKVIDNDPNSKFLVRDFDPEMNFWLQQELPEVHGIYKYTLTSGGDAPDRDPKNWELVGSNNGATWVVLDTRTEEVFSERNQTREFKIMIEESYKYYRLNIKEIIGDTGLFQLSEWRLFSLDEIEPSEPKDVTRDATLTVSHEYREGAGGNEGSLKLIDNDINSKFLYRDYTPEIDFWMQQGFSEGKVVIKYTLTSGNDAPERDPKSWELAGSNDGISWDVLDNRADEEFSGRNLTREFDIINTESYKYYKLSITETGSNDHFQLSEWRLLN